MRLWLIVLWLIIWSGSAMSAEYQYFHSDLVPYKIKYKSSANRIPNNMWMQNQHINYHLSGLFAVREALGYVKTKPVITKMWREKKDDSFNHTFFGGADYRTTGVDRFYKHIEALSLSSALGPNRRVIVEEIVTGQKLMTIYQGGRLILGPKTPSHNLTGDHNHIDSYKQQPPPYSSSFYRDLYAMPPLKNDLEKMVNALGIPLSNDQFWSLLFSIQYAFHYWNSLNTNPSYIPQGYSMVDIFNPAYNNPPSKKFKYVMKDIIKSGVVPENFGFASTSEESTTQKVNQKDSTLKDNPHPLELGGDPIGPKAKTKPETKTETEERIRWKAGVRLLPPTYKEYPKE